MQGIPFATSNSYDEAAARAMFLLAYHAALRAGELVHSNTSKHSLKIENVKLLHYSSGVKIVMVLESFKHCQKPARFMLEKNKNANLCPVTALLRFLKHRPTLPGNIFTRDNGKVYTRLFMANVLKRCIKACGLLPDDFNTHSFRAGRATDLAAAGVPEAVIKETGRWS